MLEPGKGGTSDRQADKQAGRQTNRQIDREKREGRVTDK